MGLLSAVGKGLSKAAGSGKKASKGRASKKASKGRASKKASKGKAAEKNGKTTVVPKKGSKGSKGGKSEGGKRGKRGKSGRGILGSSRRRSKRNEKETKRLDKRLDELEKAQKEEEQNKTETKNAVVPYAKKDVVQPDAEIPDSQYAVAVAEEVKKLVNPLSISNITFSQVFVGNDKKSMSYAKKVTEDNTNLLKKLVVHTEEIAENTKNTVDQDTAIKKKETGKNKYEDPEVFKSLQKSSKESGGMGWLGKLAGFVGLVALFHKQIWEWWEETAWPWITSEVEEAWEKFKGWISDEWDEFSDKVSERWDEFKTDVSNFFTDKIPDNIKKWFSESTEWIGTQLMTLWENAPEFIGKIASGLAKFIDKTFGVDVSEVFTTIGGWAKGALGMLKTGFDALMETGIPEIMENIFMLKTGFNMLKSFLGLGDKPDKQTKKDEKKTKKDEKKTKKDEKAKKKTEKKAEKAKKKADTKGKKNLKLAEAQKNKAKRAWFKESLKKAKSGGSKISKFLLKILSKIPGAKIAKFFLLKILPKLALRVGLILTGPVGWAALVAMTAVDIYLLGRWVAAKWIGEDAVNAWEADVLAWIGSLPRAAGEAIGLLDSKEERQKKIEEDKVKKRRERQKDRRLQKQKEDKEKINKQFEKVKQLQEDVKKTPSDTKKKRLYEARKSLLNMDKEYTKKYDEYYAYKELDGYFSRYDQKTYLHQLQKAKEEDENRKQRKTEEINKKESLKSGGSSAYTSGNSSEASKAANTAHVDISGIKGGADGVGGVTLTGHKKKAAQMISAHEGKYGTVGDIGDGAGISFGAYQLTRASLKVFIKQMSERGPAGSIHCKPQPKGSACLKWLKAVATTDISKKIQDEVFVNMYYDPAMRIAKKFNITDPKAQLHIIDHAVNAGTGGANRMLKRTSKGADSKTVAQARIDDYKSLHNWGKYHRSWTNRVRIIEGMDVTLDSSGNVSVNGDTGDGQNTTQGTSAISDSLNKTAGRSGGGGYEGTNDVSTTDSQPGPTGKPKFGLDKNGKGGGKKFGSFTKPSRPVNRVFVHCTASDSPAHDNVNTIRHWHTDPKPAGRGWSDIGYHYMIHKDGQISVGRPIEKTPASAKGNNTGTIAIVLHGLKKSKFTEAQFKTLQKWALEVNKAYDGKITFHGHCEVSAKTCPVFDYRKVLQLDKDGLLGIKGAVATDGKETQELGENKTSMPIYETGSQTGGNGQSGGPGNLGGSGPRAPKANSKVANSVAAKTSDADVQTASALQTSTGSPLDSLKSPAIITAKTTTLKMNDVIDKGIASAIQKADTPKTKKAVESSGMAQVYIPTMLTALTKPEMA